MCGGATRVVELSNPEYQLEAPGPTFAGRDIFAPAVAHLCRGVPLDELGPEIAATTLRPGLLPVAHVQEGEINAEVLWVDRYGNAQLNLDGDDLAPLGERVRLRFGDQVRTARAVGTFAEVVPNDIGLVIDSYGLAAIVVDQQSAADQLGLGPATGVYLSALGEGQDDGDAGPGVTTAVQLRPRPAADGDA
jgi:S-adenosylmethionine hydrolase